MLGVKLFLDTLAWYNVSQGTFMFGIAYAICLFYLWSWKIVPESTDFLDMAQYSFRLGGIVYRNIVAYALHLPSSLKGDLRICYIVMGMCYIYIYIYIVRGMYPMAPLNFFLVFPYRLLFSKVVVFQQFFEQEAQRTTSFLVPVPLLRYFEWLNNITTGIQSDSTLW